MEDKKREKHLPEKKLKQVMCWHCQRPMELCQTNAQQQEEMLRMVREENTTIPRSFGMDLGDVYRCPKCGREKIMGGAFGDSWEAMKVERKCKIVSKKQMGDAVYMVLEAGDMVRTSFKAPGQFVHIKCGDGLLLRRPISVCMCMEDQPDDLLTIVFEVRGEGTAWLARCPVGHTVDVLGLLGNGFEVSPTDRYLFVGGGIGIPPMLGASFYGGEGSAVILGGRTAEKVILQERFQEGVDEGVLSKVLIATDDGSLGYHGFVDALVRQELEQEHQYKAVLACGPKPMLKSVAKVAAEFGVPCQVSMEERMGCGIGACLVCACDMKDGSRKHVCKDGPVFDAKEVDWDA